jgi:hypothetical protein
VRQASYFYLQNNQILQGFTPYTIILSYIKKIFNKKIVATVAKILAKIAHL